MAQQHHQPWTAAVECGARPARPRNWQSLRLKRRSLNDLGIFRRICERGPLIPLAKSVGSDRGRPVQIVEDRLCGGGGRHAGHPPRAGMTASVRYPEAPKTPTPRPGTRPSDAAPLGSAFCIRMGFNRSSNDRSFSWAHGQLRYQPPTRCTRRSLGRPLGPPVARHLPRRTARYRAPRRHRDTLRLQRTLQVARCRQSVRFRPDRRRHQVRRTLDAVVRF